ncbi:MAG TPA: hypothetical protein VKT49_24940 [Bryobacteraceae bacterium]|nr:hypothetical protein [Bryobacteraceae bacterium]
MNVHLVALLVLAGFWSLSTRAVSCGSMAAALRRGYVVRPTPGTSASFGMGHPGQSDRAGVLPQRRQPR